jgi:hypothetical protein
LLALNTADLLSDIHMHLINMPFFGLISLSWLAGMSRPSTMLCPYDPYPVRDAIGHVRRRALISSQLPISRNAAEPLLPFCTIFLVDINQTASRFQRSIDITLETGPDGLMCVSVTLFLFLGASHVIPAFSENSQKPPLRNSAGMLFFSRLKANA